MTEEDSDGNDSIDLEYLQDDLNNFRDEFVIPQIKNIKDRLDELEAENEELRQTVKQQGTRIEQLDTQVENLIGVDDPDHSTHEKRVRDVRAAMIRRAEAKADRKGDIGAGKIAMYYQEIQDLLADHGHGEVYDTQVRRIMDEIENVDGFAFGKKTSPDSGRKVKALQLNLAALPTYAGTNNVVSSGRGKGGEKTRKTAAENNQN